MKSNKLDLSDVQGAIKKLISSKVLCINFMATKNTGVKKLEGKMEEFDNIAISSRIRLARNVDGLKFYTKLDSEIDASYITNAVIKTLEKFEVFSHIKLSDCSLNECNAMFERHLISKELIENKDISSLAISEDQKIIVMINEEDHIREQCIENGFNLYKPYRRLNKIDQEICKSLPIAFDNDLGFITASPSNLGTAMRASVMLFLPALERQNSIEYIFRLAKENQLTVRGCYGEGSGAKGSLYQISNQGSLGFSEDEIIDKVSQFIYDVIEKEKLAREQILSEEYEKIKDECLRSYGILTNCYSLKEDEMLSLLSSVKFGAALGFLTIKDDEKFMKLFYEGASSNLKEIFDFFENKKENIVRSEYISKEIKHLVERRNK